MGAGEPLTHTVRNVVQRGGQPALYYLNSAPARGFVREELLIVPHGTELPPDQVLMRARSVLDSYCVYSIW